MLWWVWVFACGIGWGRVSGVWGGNKVREDPLRPRGADTSPGGPGEERRHGLPEERRLGLPKTVRPWHPEKRRPDCAEDGESGYLCLSRLVKLGTLRTLRGAI
tara:strand:- start:143 stop:451 length:309 start_codon:yes stop_codon:yes gene_type:complete